MKPALRCLRVVREQVGLTVEAMAEKTGWPPEVVEVVLERPDSLRLWDLCLQEQEDPEETFAATIRTLVERDEVDHEMVFFLTTLGSKYLALRRRFFGRAFDAGSKRAIVAALLQADIAVQADIAAEEWSHEGDVSEPQETERRDLTALLRLAADLRVEHPRVADALLFAVAYSAAKLKDSSQRLRYLVCVSLGLLRPKEAQAVSARPEIRRAAAQGELLFHLSDVWRIGFGSQELGFMEGFAEATEAPELPEARKKGLMKVYEAMIRDVVARSGDAETVRQAVAKVEKAYEERPVSVEAVTVDFLTTALLAMGTIEGWSTVYALVESVGHLSLILHGNPMQELESFPNMTGVIRELLSAGV